MGYYQQTRPARASELSDACHPVGAGEAEAIAERLYDIRGSATRFETEKDDTFLLDCADRGKFVLKIAHPSERVEELDFQVALLRHIEGRAPDLPIPRAHRDVDGTELPIVTTSAGERRVVRLITFLSGTPLDRTTSTGRQRERIGEVLARLRLAMADFSHPADSRTLAWDVTHLLDLSDLLGFIPAGGKRAWTTRALERFAEIKPQLDLCRRQVLHNDFNTSNLVVDQASPQFLTGVIDFGDAVRTAIAVDVSTALMNQMPKTFDRGKRRDLFDEPRDILRGYLRHAELTDEELRLIPFLAQGRLAVRALLTCWRAELFPENSRYILRNTEAGWAHLEWFNSMSTAQISDLLTREEPAMTQQATTLPKGFRGDMANGFNPRDASHLPSEDAAHVARRQRLLGPAYRLFYKSPVEISRAKGVFLYDRHGNEYLDAYNNVVSLGHSHPRVVEAIQKQLETLCTHTRYMQEPLLDYAETLIGTFGGELGRTGCAMFTCTGSEANDLALRIARYHTRRTGVIVTAEAYHGNSGAVAAISPSLGKKSALDPYVRTVAAPDSYRLPVAEIGRRMAEDVARQIADLERHGDGLAAFIADSVFSSDGLYVDPSDVLAPVAEIVRKAGGLFIADEVQSGFGRTGTHLWGHARHKVDPDIVTLGKPMGNGYPVAGLVVRPELVAEFGASMRYFNTFGGNSVAIAAAQAVLDTIFEENLMDNATRVGGEVLDGLRELQNKYEFVGDVRGAGLYFAVELVKDHDRKVPDMDRALAAVNALRDQRILISATGADAHILKIRPPLVFTSANAGRLLEGVDNALRAVQT